MAALTGHPAGVGHGASLGPGKVDLDSVVGVHLATPVDTVAYWLGYRLADHPVVLPHHQLGSASMGELMFWLALAGMVLATVGILQWFRHMDVSYKDDYPTDRIIWADVPKKAE